MEDSQAANMALINELRATIEKDRKTNDGRFVWLEGKLFGALIQLDKEVHVRGEVEVALGRQAPEVSARIPISEIKNMNAMSRRQANKPVQARG